MAKRASTKQKQEAFLKALEKSLGVVTPAAQAAKIERKTVYNWKNNDPEFLERYNEVTSVAGDFVESSAFKQVKEGNGYITWKMLCNLKPNKYRDKQEHEVKGNMSISWIEETYDASNAEEESQDPKAAI